MLFGLLVFDILFIVLAVNDRKPWLIAFAIIGGIITAIYLIYKAYRLLKNRQRAKVDDIVAYTSFVNNERMVIKAQIKGATNAIKRASQSSHLNDVKRVKENLETFNVAYYYIRTHIDEVPEEDLFDLSFFRYEYGDIIEFIVQYELYNVPPPGQATIPNYYYLFEFPEKRTIDENHTNYRNRLNEAYRGIIISEEEKSISKLDCSYAIVEEIFKHKKQLDGVELGQLYSLIFRACADYRKYGDKEDKDEI